MEKSEVARRQLGMALQLFLEDRDSASVHCLACGGGEVSEYITRQAGGLPFSRAILDTRPELNEDALRRIRNQYWNSFKHATTKKGLDRGDEEVLTAFRDDMNDHALFIGWFDYQNSGRPLPIEVQVFQVWYFAMYPEKVGKISAVEISLRIFGADLHAVARSEAKRRLRQIIDHFRESPEVTNHSMTERLPLDLGII